MGVGSGLYMYDVVVKRLRSLSHLLMSSCYIFIHYSFSIILPQELTVLIIYYIYNIVLL